MKSIICDKACRLMFSCGRKLYKMNTVFEFKCNLRRFIRRLYKKRKISYSNRPLKQRSCIRQSYWFINFSTVKLINRTTVLTYWRLHGFYFKDLHLKYCPLNLNEYGVTTTHNTNILWQINILRSRINMISF